MGEATLHIDPHVGRDMIGGIGAKVIPKKTYKMKGQIVESEATPESSSQSLHPRSSQPVKT
jgi:hypothetical protein